MRDLENVAIECMEMLDRIGIEYGNVKEIVPNSRAKSRWGQCKQVKDGFSININIDLLDERNPLMALQNTIIHELLHTCPGCMNHGANWKKHAKKVTAVYGIKIQRVSSKEEKGVTYKRSVAKKKSEYIYQIECECCGATFTKTKLTKTIMHPELYRCFCGGKLHRIK